MNESKKEGMKERQQKKPMAILTVKNKARYAATEVACGWAGAIFEVTSPFGQEQ